MRSEKKNKTLPRTMRRRRQTQPQKWTPLPTTKQKRQLQDAETFDGKARKPIRQQQRRDINNDNHDKKPTATMWKSLINN